MESNYVSETCKNECLGGLRIMSDNELLLAISEMMDVKLDARLKPIENRLQRIEVDLLENNVLPRLNTLEKCYTSTYERYKENCDKMESAMDDIRVIKRVVIEHSGQLAHLTETVDKHTEQLMHLTETVDKHTEQLAHLTETVDKHTEQLAHLTQTVEGHTEEFKKLNSRVDSLEKCMKEK